MAKQTKAELLEKVSKARRKKLEEELTGVVNLMAPHLKEFIRVCNCCSYIPCELVHWSKCILPSIFYSKEGVPFNIN